MDNYKDARSGKACFGKRCKNAKGEIYWVDPELI